MLAFSWSEFTMYYVAVNLILMFCFTIVTTIGGAFDLSYLLKELGKKVVDELDDGRVLDDQEEEPVSE